MRKILLASSLLWLMAGSGPAPAQGLNITVDTREPVTHLEPEQWAGLMRRFVNAGPLVGTPLVDVINASGDTIVAITCDRWQLVGNQPYIKTNPHSLPPWSVTEISADGFDGYCKGGVSGMSSAGDVYKGLLNAPDGTFSNSTFITFSPRSRQ